jgi:hypothetical protein
MRAVFVKQGVSLGCEIGAGRARWWLTKESGCVPAGCWQGGDCRRCCEAVVLSGPRGLVRAYVIVKIVSRLRHTVWSSVVIGLLSVATLEVVVQNIVSPLACVRLDDVAGSRTEEFGRDYRTVAAVLRQTSRGGYSSGVECRCAAGKVCAACKEQPADARSFVVQNRYAGVDPRGRGHWFRGVTDAIGEMSSWQSTWQIACHG